MLRRPVYRIFALAIVTTSLAACQSTNGPNASDGMMFHSVAEKVGVATPAVEPKDFVKAARGPKGDYMPVGITPENGKLKVRDEAGVKNLRNELESTARKSEKAGEAAKQ